MTNKVCRVCDARDAVDALDDRCLGCFEAAERAAEQMNDLALV